MLETHSADTCCVRTVHTHTLAEELAGVVLDLFRKEGQAGVSCAVTGASYIKQECCHVLFVTELQALTGKRPCVQQFKLNI